MLPTIVMSGSRKAVSPSVRSSPEVTRLSSVRTCGRAGVFR